MLSSLFQVGRFKIFFCFNEMNDPIHVHIKRGKLAPKGTKVWLTSTGGCILANNDSRLALEDLKELLQIISAQFFLICDAWKVQFNIKDIEYYC